MPVPIEGVWYATVAKDATLGPIIVRPVKSDEHRTVDATAGHDYQPGATVMVLSVPDKSPRALGVVE